VALSYMCGIGAVLLCYSAYSAYDTHMRDSLVALSYMSYMCGIGAVLLCYSAYSAYDTHIRQCHKRVSHVCHMEYIGYSTREAIEPTPGRNAQKLIMLKSHLAMGWGGYDW